MLRKFCKLLISEPHIILSNDKATSRTPREVAHPNGSGQSNKMCSG
jgi:hypothetical protein